MEGVLVLKDYNMSIMLKEELTNFTPLVCASIFQSIKVKRIKLIFFLLKTIIYLTITIKI